MTCSECAHPTHVCFSCGAWYVCQTVGDGLTNVREFVGQGMGSDQRTGEYHLSGAICPDCDKALVLWMGAREETDGE